METLSLSLFTSFEEITLGATYPLVLGFDVVSQTVLNVLRTLQLSMDSIYRFPKADPSLTHTAELVTIPTLWWCTSCQDPCIHLKFMTIYPTDMNTAVLSLLIPPTHKCVKNLECQTQKNRNLVNFCSSLSG